MKRDSTYRFASVLSERQTASANYYKKSTSYALYLPFLCTRSYNETVYQFTRRKTNAHRNL